MGIKKFKPTSAGRRFQTVSDYQELTTDRPYKPLVVKKTRSGGRDNRGLIAVRHRGGGHKRRYRILDFRRDKDGIPAMVATIEYDPNRSARISLVNYAVGEKRYILHCVGVKVGDTVMSGPGSEIKPGNAFKINDIPDCIFIHNVELTPGRGGQMMRAAGAQAQLMSKDGDFAHLKMPSGEIRLIRRDCMATIGQVSNIEHDTITLGNAGRSRHRGIRPTVRGGAMNAVDHPLGGGRGKSKGGNHPRSPWNQPSKGYKTRNKKKIWGWMIVQDRRRAKAQG